jgi:hypothetical protein
MTARDANFTCPSAFARQAGAIAGQGLHGDGRPSSVDGNIQALDACGRTVAETNR